MKKRPFQNISQVPNRSNLWNIWNFKKRQFSQNFSQICEIYEFSKERPFSQNSAGSSLLKFVKNVNFQKCPFSLSFTGPSSLKFNFWNMIFKKNVHFYTVWQVPPSSNLWNMWIFKKTFFFTKFRRVFKNVRFAKFRRSLIAQICEKHGFSKNVHFHQILQVPPRLNFWNVWIFKKRPLYKILQDIQKTSISPKFHSSLLPQIFEICGFSKKLPFSQNVAGPS